MMIRTIDFECKCGNQLFHDEGGVADGLAYYDFIKCTKCGKDYELHPHTERVYVRTDV